MHYLLPTELKAKLCMLHMLLVHSNGVHESDVHKDAEGLAVMNI